MASSLEEDKDLAFVSNFSETIQGIDTDSKRIELFHKLWDAITSLLNKYPKEGSVLETVCRTFTSSTIYGILPDSYDSSESFVTLFLTTLTNFNWKNGYVNLVQVSVEVTGSLMEVFEEYLTSDQIGTLSSFLSRLLSPETFGNKDNETLALTAGKAFPLGYSDRVLYKLLLDKVHIRMFQLLTYYSNMSEEQLRAVILACIAFIDYEPSVANDIVQENIHFMILFAAQKFTASESVQSPLWVLLSKIVEYASDVVPDLSPITIVPILEKVTQISTVQPVCTFLINYMMIAGALIVDFCLTESQRLLSTLLQLLEDLSEPLLQCSKVHLSNLEIIAKVLAIVCSVKTSRSAIREIVTFDIISTLANAAIKCPQRCAFSYCMALEEILSSVATENLFSRNQPGVQVSELFYSRNHLLPFYTLLQSSLLSETRNAVYSSLRQLLRHAPEKSIYSWITKDFLEIYIPAFATDVAQCKLTTLHQYVFTAHIITYFIKTKELTQVLYDLKLHDIAIDVCLTRATYREGRNNTLNFINCLLRTYNEFLKDHVDVFAKSELPNVLVQLASKYGRGQKSDIGDQFSSLVLGMTADKTASNVLHERGILKKFYPLVSSDYDSVIVRNAIHSIGNIALAGHNVKQEILTDKFQHVLISLIDKQMEKADSSVLTASCRVLHILCSGDWAKREFAEEGLVDILIRLIQCRGNGENSTPEMCWRPLGLLSSISFMSLCNRQYLITDKIVTTIIDLMETAEDPKVISYFALVFLAFSDVDRHSSIMCRSGVINKFQELLGRDSFSSNNDLKRWGTSLIEKGHLFTVKESFDRNLEIMTSLFDSITWPPSYSLFKEVNGTKLISIDDVSQLSARFPEGSTLSADQLKGLGLTPDHTLFRISRVYGSTHGLCSNCEKEGPSEELVFRPHNLTPIQYQALIARGWYRRGGVKFFRYRYNHNLECSDWETRVILSQFDSRKRKSYRKVLRRMPEENLTIETIPTQFVQEAYDLYNSYHSLKHDKPRKSRFSYCEHVVNSPMRNQTIDGMDYGTFHQLYRINGKLIAVGVIDVVPNGVVSIYMWYDMSKDVTKLSPGVYSALREIQYAQELSKRDPNLQYYYLQGWNGNNHKLAYKGNYEPEDFYSPCTVVDWVRGLDGVAQARKEFVPSTDEPDSVSTVLPPVTSSKEGDATNNEEEPNSKETAVSGVALPLDRKWYKSITGRDTVDTSKLVVCLNDKKCMYLSDVVTEYGISSEQCDMMKERYEELVLALGPELSSNMIIDLKLC